MGWAGLKNGDLLDRAERQFDVLIPADRRLRYQQNLSRRKLAIVILPTNQVPAVTVLLPVIEQTLADIQPGTVVEIPLSRTS